MAVFLNIGPSPAYLIHVIDPG